MTRKEALQRAVHILSTDPEQAETVEKLKDLLGELPLVHWTDKSIRDSIDQFVLEHGKPPTVTDFKREGLPPHPVVANRYGITLGQWLAENYPVNESSHEDITVLYNKQFLEEFRRLQPSSADAYNRDRSSDAKCWQTVANRNGEKTWSSLLKRLGLEVQPKHRTPQSFSVTIHNDYDFRD